MVKEYYMAICQGKEIRQNLISLRRELKQEENKRALAYLLGGDFRVLLRLLKEQDPKIRKNAALILGDMETEDVLPFLFEAYEKEQTLFVRADYLKAMEHMDVSAWLGKLKHRLEELEEEPAAEPDRKHAEEEKKQLRGILLKYEKPRKHVFCGYTTVPEVILVTNRCQIGATRSQITTGSVAEFSQGLRIKGGDLKELQRIRTVTELLIPIPGGRAVSGTAEQIGSQLASLGIADFLESLHRGSGAFLYRMELKGTIPLEKRGAFIRKITAALERDSGRRLQNTVTDYEAELRLLQKKDGSFVPMIKLFTLPDQRFSYRKETVASSISPVNAALTVQLAKPYLKEGAQILDPFCGVGTMLIERNRAVAADPMYGVDLFGEAIEKARVNTKRAGDVIHYINKDYFDFSHGYLFDEIITDMPRAAGNGTGRELEELYRDFFEKSLLHLKENGKIILYTMNPELVDRGWEYSGSYRKLEEFLINEKNQTKVYVFEKIGQ